MPAKTTRRLICVPVIRTPAELGSIAEAVEQFYARKPGAEQQERPVRSEQDVWQKARRLVEGLKLAYQRLKLYQDGLPNCGHETEVVKNLARSGSRNHQFLLDLVKKGATLIGTESPDLLLEEYELAQQSLARLAANEKTGLTESQRQRSRLILEERDRYIAARIDKTLERGETGLLFLRTLHSLEPHLPSDIRVTREVPQS